jgi:polyisoprenoid-binding protein YceI
VNDLEDQMANALENAVAERITWQLDPAHTQVGFAVRHMMFATVKGQFRAVAGELELNGADLSDSRVRITIDAASIDTGVAGRDEHLRSADFFDAATHPELTFVSKRVHRAADGSLRVIGDLSIRGVTQEVSVTARETGRGTDPWGKERIGFTGEAKIDRREFGLKWNQALETGGVLVSDEVKITLDVQAVRA